MPHFCWECADCGTLVSTPEQAIAHEAEFDPDDLHGGWDPVPVPEGYVQ